MVSKGLAPASLVGTRAENELRDFGMRDLGPYMLSHVLTVNKAAENILAQYAFRGDCSRATGLIQPAHDEVMQGFVAGLRLGLHAT